MYELKNVRVVSYAAFNVSSNSVEPHKEDFRTSTIALLTPINIKTLMGIHRRSYFVGLRCLSTVRPTALRAFSNRDSVLTMASHITSFSNGNGIGSPDLAIKRVRSLCETNPTRAPVPPSDKKMSPRNVFLMRF